MPWTCQNFTSSYNSSPEMFLYGYALPGLCLLGALANILNIVVLADRRLVAPTYIYLIYLAIADLITLLLYFIDLISRMHFANHLLSHIFTAYIYLPIGSISTCSSLLLTVAVTIDRYVFIQNPTAITSHAVPISIQLEMPRKKARKFGAVVCLLSAIINGPRMAAWYVDFDTGCRRSRDWVTDPNGWFSVYSYLRLLLLNIGSIIVLATFNILLIFLVQESTSRRESRQSFSVANGKALAYLQQSAKKRRFSLTGRVFSRTNVSLTVTLIAATLLALSGEIPSTLFSRISAGVIWNDSRILDQEPYRYFVLTAYILILLEYSGNFVIYCLLNKRFRLVLSSKLGPNQSEEKISPKHIYHHHHRHSRTSKERIKRRSISLDHISQQHRNGSVADRNSLVKMNNESRRNSSLLCENTDNLVTEDGKVNENLSEFWRITAAPPPTSSLLKPMPHFIVVKGSNTYPNIIALTNNRIANSNLITGDNDLFEEAIPSRCRGNYLI